MGAQRRQSVSLSVCFHAPREVHQLATSRVDAAECIVTVCLPFQGDDTISMSRPGKPPASNAEQVALGVV